MKVIPKKELDRVGVVTSREYKEYVRGLTQLLDDVATELMECQYISKSVWKYGIHVKEWVRIIKKTISQAVWGR